MNICILYYSTFGNGKKLMDHLESILKGKGHVVTLLPVIELKPPTLPPADLYFFSTPTHMGGPPGKMKRFLKKMEVGEGSGKYALVSTCMDLKAKTLMKMENLLLQKKMNKITEGLLFLVTGMKGPLKDGYQQKLEDYASDVLEAMTSIKL